MSEPMTMDEKIKAAVEARDKGIPVDAWALLAETWNVMSAEIQRLNALLEPEETTGAE